MKVSSINVQIKVLEEAPVPELGFDAHLYLPMSFPINGGLRRTPSVLLNHLSQVSGMSFV